MLNAHPEQMYALNRGQIGIMVNLFKYIGFIGFLIIKTPQNPLVDQKKKKKSY